MHLLWFWSTQLPEPPRFYYPTEAILNQFDNIVTINGGHETAELLPIAFTEVEIVID